MEGSNPPSDFALIRREGLQGRVEAASDVVVSPSGEKKA